MEHIRINTNLILSTRRKLKRNNFKKEKRQKKTNARDAEMKPIHLKNARLKVNNVQNANYSITLHPNVNPNQYTKLMKVKVSPVNQNLKMISTF